MDELRLDPDEAEENNSETTDAAVPERSSPLVPLVGIGGSAGSVAALEAFFKGMPPDPGLAFAVVLHQTAEAEHQLATMLQNFTAMRVVEVRQTCAVEADTVYVVPPGKVLRTGDGFLQLTEPSGQHPRHVAVDLFFRSLADTHGPHATAIVLSGLDGDGAIGIKRIKERGGLTIAQDPTHAEHGDMPRAALATGMIDWVLPARAMPERLLDYHRRERQIRLPPERVPKPAQPPPAGADEGALRDVLSFLRTRTGRDFSYYKRATIVRRIGRRMQVNGIDDLHGYLDCLRTRPGEAGALLQDLLISVTNFFRDPECFATLEAHIAELFENKAPGESIRVWVAACATGEEAYSVAIMLSEYARRMEAAPLIQVFASDLDDEAIRTARDGLYPMAIEADVSEERLRRYFMKEHGGYRLRREVREMVLFAVHDVLKDSPFSRLDLVTCRNLLIYLNRAAQRRAFDTFHFSLKPGGLMFLGSSESVEDGSSQFAVVDKKHRLYAQRSTPRVALLPVPSGPGTLALALALEAQHTARSGPVIAGQAFAQTPMFNRPPPSLEGRVNSWAELHFRLLEQIAPPSILVDADYDIVHLSPGAGTFLRHAGGEPSRNLLRVIHPGLRIELRAALYQAAQRQESLEMPPLMVEIDGAEKPVAVRVVPASTFAPGYLMVVLQTGNGDLLAPPREAIRSAAAADPVANHLDRELERMKLHLRDTVEQYEASTEELKASNEELQAMNEELRSATEELETSREELQSINEELTTVNHELKTKVDELGHANSDMHNLMDATAIATIFLDRELRITRFTPSAVTLFNLIATDIGRPLSDLATHLDYDDLAGDARRVLERLVPIEREVGKADGQWFLVRALPYRTLDDHIAGVVLTFVDVTERKLGQEALRISQERFGAIVNQAAAGVAEVSLDGRVAFANVSYRDMLGYDESEIVGLSLPEIVDADGTAVARGLFEQLARDGEAFQVEMRCQRKDGSLIWTFNSVSRLTSAVGGPDAALVMCVDITERKEAEEALSRSEELLRLIVENAVEFAIFSTDPEMRVTRWNSGAERLLGYSEAEVLGQSADIIFTPEDRALHAPAQEMQQALAEGRGSDDRLHRRKDGSTFWASGALMPMLADGVVVGFVKILRDQSQARQSRHALERSRAELVEALAQKQAAHDALEAADAAKDRFLAVLSHELRNPLASIHDAARALQSGRLDEPEKLQAAAIMARQSTAMKSLLDDLLDISRLRLGRLELKRERVLLSDVVQSGVEATRPAMEEGRHELQVTLPEAPVELLADPVRLSQVLSNLLANAARYTPTGGRISLSAQVEAGWLVISLEDNGIGMEAGAIDTMFEMFVQHSGGEHPTRGLGIGLALVRNIMELHGGQVDGSSAGTGQGSRFMLRLPLGETASEDALAAGATHGAAEATHAAAFRVLVADDNADAAWSIAKLLSLSGCEVRTVASGATAVDEIAAWRPDAAVLDIGMPGMDGYQVARRVRATAAADELLLIAATGWGQKSDRQAALDAGFDAHLVKPVDQLELRVLIDGWRQRRSAAP